MTEDDVLVTRIKRRILPLLLICAVVAYLDRVNVSFAAVTMLADRGISIAAYGLGVGLFFAAYFLFELPSNLLLNRFGARQWIARIMFTWGLLSGAMVFVQGERSFYVLRFLLGIAEAGFFPGIIYYLNSWIPPRYRGSALGLFMICVPLPTVIGAPLSGWLLQLDGWLGMHGWQWMYMIEAAPALVLAVVVFFQLPNGPGEARWLDSADRKRLGLLLADESSGAHRQHLGVGEVLRDRSILLLSLAYFGILGTNYGLSFFIPQMIRSFGVSTVQVGYITALPYLAGALAMVFWPRHSDRTGERWLHCVVAVALASICIIGAAMTSSPVIKVTALTIAGLGIFGAVPVFWTLPSYFLRGPAAAPGIAVINSIGNLAGFCGPYMMGLTVQRTGSYLVGSTIIGVFGMLSFMTLVAMARRHARGPQGAQLRRSVS
ncbi:MFS transporter [Paraburkholderia silviterrae]|uniref:MFS transporter n=1 Tax=Paraburkholderia silviterrae TaxID=2528715 RepID=A0A4R5M809_9BURK|nr:MFS transporter [Paraburkholderia silviterrae]TDG21746.1 MFS transporter [Paraburkholderia silviterrae]